MTSPGRVALDRLEIGELRATYARAIDYEEWDAAFEVFTDDAVVEYREGTFHGAEAVYEYWRDNVDYRFSMHTMLLPQIDVDGDTAWGHWYLMQFYVMPDGTEGWVFGWYEDEYRRVDGEWQIDHLDMSIEYDTGNVHT
ncbi:nuclear transport factor 2 family protein [Halorarius litoreus]|uniref:nuclear transport factor 2 family protein n=1 Tax=Halorarius litoreus TaxID=2962676 RepID=UPI0020CE75EE|nr:nuclear transport factor 2 family protein [Halorarius litoreus]